jgi:hypothetical protein
MSNKIACLVGETIHSKSQTKTTRLKRRLFGNIASTYEIDQNFSFMARIEWISNDFRWSRRPIGSSRYTGMYREQTIAFTEYNADMLLSYDNTFGNFSVKFSYGQIV